MRVWLAAPNSADAPAVPAQGATLPALKPLCAGLVEDITECGDFYRTRCWWSVSSSATRTL